MAAYFWAGLLTGLLIWALAEALLYLRRPVSRRLSEQIFAVVRAKDHVEDLEYSLRRIRADLKGCGFSCCRILLSEQGLDAENREIAQKIDGVRLCTEEQLVAAPLEL